MHTSTSVALVLLLVPSLLSNDSSFVANPPSISAGFVVGAPNPPAIPIAIGSRGINPIEPFTATVSAQTPWLLINGSTTVNGTTPMALSVMFNVAGLAAQTYTGKIIVTPPGGGIALEIPVTLTGASLTNQLVVGSNAPPIFTYQVGAQATVPGSITFTVSSSGPAALDWNAVVTIVSGPPNWLVLQPSSGNTASAAPGAPIATVNTTGLAPGTYSATITFRSSTATNTPVIPVSLIVTPSAAALRFVPLGPCRVADTRLAAGPFGGPLIAGNTTRDFAIPASACGVPEIAQAYAFNVTVVPQNPLGFLSAWPAGQPRPMVSTLNSTDGRIKANGAIVPAGAAGAISVYVTDATHLVLDINGYFVPAGAMTTLGFFPINPCRVIDTRQAAGTSGGPSLAANSTRSIPVLQSSCGLPSTARAYSLNVTAVPKGPLGYLTVWPDGGPQPFVSTLNAPTGTVVANAAIVPAGVAGGISVYATDATDLVIDLNGFFMEAGGFAFYSLFPCRAVDTRLAAGLLGGPALAAGGTRTFSLATQNVCGMPSNAVAYAMSATVVPVDARLGYLTLWPAGATMPLASTLNSLDGTIVSNAALVVAAAGVPGGVAGVNSYATDSTHLILDVNGYFAP